MILHIAPDYINKPLYAHLLEAIRSLNNADEQVVYACDNNSHPESSRNPNIHIVNRHFSIIERLLFFPKQRYLLRDIEQRIPIQNIDVIHAHTLFSGGYLAYRLHKKYGIPYIVAVRNTDVNVFFRWMPHLRVIGRKIATCAQKIIFISPAYKQQVLEHYLPKETRMKAIVIPNGIDSLFLKNISQHTPTKDVIRMIYVGRIEKAKNIDTILHVADMLIQQGRTIHLSLVGEFKDPLYKAQIDARADYIEWYNACPPQNVMDYLRQNDIFIMPSFHETFGLVYAEAMSQGLPIIYTKGQGFDGFFEDGKVGYRVPANDAEYITDKIIDIHHHYTEFSNNCIQNVHLFDWKKIATEYNNLYQLILNESTC